MPLRNMAIMFSEKSSALTEATRSATNSDSVPGAQATSTT
jgi:hypothetical protein